jgi:hypothetical protein
MQDQTAAAGAQAKCESCHAPLGIELLRFFVSSPDEAWWLCAACVMEMLSRAAVAHEEAGAVLEEMWEQT